MNEIATVGFTGTRGGMTPQQRDKLMNICARVLSQDSMLEFHHGCCIGADAEAHRMVYEGFHEECRRIVGHPCNLSAQREHTLEGFFDMYPERPPLTRNRWIAANVDILIAMPGTSYEVRRSGTWATIRYRRAEQRQMYVVFPSGETGDLY